jgi:hypothetical protein
MSTNAEQRPTFTATLKLSITNQTFSHLYAFLASLARWAYNSVLSKAMPELLGKTTLLDIETFITDGEEKLYGPLVVLTEPGDVWEGSNHNLCMYHLVDRQLGLEGLRVTNSVASGKCTRALLLNGYTLGLIHLKRLRNLSFPSSS